MASKVQLPPSFKPTHETAGLPGYPATDVFAPAGDVVRAPTTGVLQNVHMIPWDAAKRVGGLTGYLVSPQGTYFLTHMGSAVPSGTRVSAGQVIGTVAAVPGGAWQPHIHEGLNSGVAQSLSGSYSAPSGGGNGAASAGTTYQPPASQAPQRQYDPRILAALLSTRQAVGLPAPGPGLTALLSR